MNTSNINRRTVLKSAGLLAGAMVANAGVARAKEKALRLASNQYSWTVYYQRENRDFNSSLDDGFKDVAASGIDGFESNITSPEQIDTMAPLLKKHGLEMRSLYVNSVLHEKAQADKSIADILAIAQKAKGVGTRIIVTNPSPIRWGGPEDKDDAQIRFQAQALEALGRELAGMGLVLAYHNHDAELRNAAREFHHMLTGTDPRYVTLCLDAHWVYRGAGNSEVAVFDVAKLYTSRITELHLRQSRNGVWSETFGEGDIDYPALADFLLRAGVKPHLVLEQASEKGTPQTMDPVTVHRQSSAYVHKIFAGFAG